eukprot:6489726-Amphidinium_carterae.2
MSSTLRIISAIVAPTHVFSILRTFASVTVHTARPTNPVAYAVLNLHHLWLAESASAHNCGIFPGRPAAEEPKKPYKTLRGTKSACRQKITKDPQGKKSSRSHQKSRRPKKSARRQKDAEGTKRPTRALRHKIAQGQGTAAAAATSECHLPFSMCMRYMLLLHLCHCHLVVVHITRASGR